MSTRNFYAILDDDNDDNDGNNNNNDYDGNYKSDIINNNNINGNNNNNKNFENNYINGNIKKNSNIKYWNDIVALYTNTQHFPLLIDSILKTTPKLYERLLDQHKARQCMEAGELAIKIISKQKMAKNGNLTIESLIKNQIHAQSNQTIRTAMETIFNKMMAFVRHTKTLIERADQFVNFLNEKTQQYFNKIVSHNDGDGCSGSFLSMHSWHIGKTDDKKPIYVYITSIEPYGSCSGCDHRLAVVDNINEIYDYCKYINDIIAIPTTPKGLLEEVKQLKNGLAHFLKWYMKQEMLQIFAKLHFHETYQQAKAHVIRSTDSYVTFNNKRKQKPVKKDREYTCRKCYFRYDDSYGECECY